MGTTVRQCGATARRLAAIGAGKLAAFASRELGRGGGTAFPGAVATRLYPSVVPDLAGRLERGSILVSGTNGKTTTSRMLAAILSDAGYAPVRNDAGSNLVRGIASSLVQESDLLGRLPDSRTVGLFEVDEAALPELALMIRPFAVLLLDLFRDQLDRYGEVATVARLWAGAFQRLAADVALVVNGDDPLLADTALSSPLTPTFFGVESAQRQTVQREHASDVKSCPRCGGPIEYTAVFLGHLGHYACTRCAFARPQASILAKDVDLAGFDGSSFTLMADRELVQVRLPLPGLYNVYNALAAAAMAFRLGIPLESSARSLAGITPAFGRMQRLDIEGRTVYLALAKNPAGLNEVLRTATESGEPLHLYVMLNDNTADGHDISWIWDADVELLEGNVSAVVFGGTRAADMALRFKYAEVLGVVHEPTWEIGASTADGFRRALALTPLGGRLVAIPTYTALLDLHSVLTRMGHVKAYWES